MFPALSRTVAMLALFAAVCTRVTGAAEPCGHCRGTAAGMGTPYGDTGCGPRYCGERHEPSRPDPCDCSNRWRGCNGAREVPEMLAPWQLPPGRGFQSGAAVGYRSGPCMACGPSWSGR